MVPGIRELPSLGLLSASELTVVRYLALAHVAATRVGADWLRLHTIVHVAYLPDIRRVAVVWLLG